MKSLHGMASVAVAFALCALPGAASASTSASIYASDSGISLGFEYFEDDLEPYGEWVDSPDYGHCWVPAQTYSGWRPYHDGYWTYTDCGWSWVSNEPWGWATYHYGRWSHDPYHGWMWVPGNVWAPSWVAWHCGDGYVGWAPLPPAAHWNVSVGLRFGGVDRISSRDWCYVEQRHFTHSQVKYKIVDSSRNDRIHRKTRNVTRFESWEGRPRNVGLELADVNGWGGGKVKKLHAIDAGSSRKGRPERVRGNSVEYYRPKISGENLARETRVRGNEREVKRSSEAVDRQLTKRSSKPAERELAMTREARPSRESRETRVTRSTKRAESPRSIVQERRQGAPRKERVESRAPERKQAEVRQNARPTTRREARTQEARPTTRREARTQEARPSETRRVETKQMKARGAEPTRRQAARQVEERRSAPSRQKAATTRSSDGRRSASKANGKSEKSRGR